MPDETITVPDALEKYTSTLNVVGVLIAVLSAVLCFALKKLSCLILLLCSAYLFIRSRMVLHDFAKGKIIERVGICESVRLSPLNKDKISMTFSFVTDGSEVTEYKTFVLFGKNRLDDFAVHGTYLIYYDVTADAQILAYQAV